jgi:hypothetical protein
MMQRLRSAAQQQEIHRLLRHGKRKRGKCMTAGIA